MVLTSSTQCELDGRMPGFAHEYRARGLTVVAINANDRDRNPQDGPAAMLDDVA